MTRTESFAKRFNIHTKLDECGEQILPGSRAHLWFDGSDLCLMGLDARLTKAALTPLGGRQWIGALNYDAKRRGMRDVDIRAIPEERWKLAVRLARCPKIRKVSPEQRELLCERLATYAQKQRSVAQDAL